MHFLYLFNIILAVLSVIPVLASSYGVRSSEVSLEQTVDSADAEAGPASIRQPIGSNRRQGSDRGNDRTARMSPPEKLSYQRSKRSRHRTDGIAASDAPRDVDATESSAGHEQELASMATHAARSILGDSLHPVGSPRQRRKPPPIPFEDLKAVDRQSDNSARDTNAESAADSYDANSNWAAAEMDLSRLSTKRAAQEHVEKSLGHHRRRRKNRSGRRRYEKTMPGGQGEL